MARANRHAGDQEAVKFSHRVNDPGPSNPGRARQGRAGLDGAADVEYPPAREPSMMRANREAGAKGGHRAIGHLYPSRP